MRTINTTFKTFGASLLLLGLKGDSNATEILIDCAESLEEYQGTMAAMSITGPDDTVYPGDISLDENGIVHWVVAARDCGIAGHGSARVDLVDDEGTVVASAEARTIVMKTNMQGVAPDQIANWTEAASVALQEARAALLDLIDLDTTATANEAARQLAETGRVSAETLRASAETARASAETARATAETARASAESSRATAENTRASAENTRIAAENARVSEFSTIEANAQAALSYIGPSEASSTASAAHAAGSYFIYNGNLYQATAAIAIGDTITSGTNCVQVPGGSMGEVSNLESTLNDNLYPLTEKHVYKFDATKIQVFPFEFVPGEKYTFKNTSPSGVAVGARTQEAIDSSTGTELITASGNIGSGVSVEFTVTQSAHFLRIYISGAGSCEIVQRGLIIEQLQSITKETETAINVGLDSKAINGTVFGWANEGIRATDGYISSNSKRLRITNPIQDIIKKIITPSSCEYAIFAFTSPGAEYGTYIGWWTGTAWSSGNIVWKKGETSFDNLRAQYNYYLFIVLKDSGNADISISFASNLSVYNEFGRMFELSDKITESGNIFTDGSWEVGSIASATGDNYDSNINAIRTKTFYYLDGVTLSVANGWRGRWFKYQADGTYIGTGDWFKFGDRVLLEAGYYRIILTETPTPQETTGTEWVNLFANGKFSQAVAEITGEGMDCTVEGKKIDLSVQKFGVKQLYDIPWRTGVSVSNQGIDSANGTLFILWDDGYVSLVNINTGALIAEYEIESGHGNACQFSDEYYDASDDYPLLYCYDYDHRVYVNRVTASGATLIKTYNLPIDGYRLSGGYDAVSKKLVTVHYKANSSTSGENNYCVLSVWDLLTVTENDGEYVPALVSEVKIPFIPVIQDCKYYKGLLYITTGYWVTYHYPLVIYAFDTAGNCITKVDDFPGFMIENDYAEAEGISFYKDSGKYRMIFALHYVYELFMN